MIELGEWQMIMRGPDGDEYPIASGPLPATLIPDHDDDGRVVLTIELAQFVRGLGDQIEQLAITGQIPDMVHAHDVDDFYSEPPTP